MINRPSIRTFFESSLRAQSQTNQRTQLHRHEGVMNVARPKNPWAVKEGRSGCQMRPHFLSSSRMGHLALCQQKNVRIAACVHWKSDDTPSGKKDLREIQLWTNPQRLYSAQGRIRHNLLRSALGPFPASSLISAASSVGG